MIKPEKNKKPIIPEIAVLGSSSAKDRKGGKNQYHTPATPTRVVTIEGPSPQYHAEKTTAAHTV
jgi:hypothetical protein